MVDPRNTDPSLGFVDVIGYRLTVGNQQQIKKLPINLNTWQNLWIRFATDMDQKNKNTAGKNSRYYKMLNQMRQERNNNRNARPQQQMRVPLNQGSKKIQKERHTAARGGGKAESDDKEAVQEGRRKKGAHLDDGDDDDEQEDNINQQDPPEADQ